MLQYFYDQTSGATGAAQLAADADILTGNYSSSLIDDFRISKMEGIVTVDPDSLDTDDFLAYLLADGDLGESEVEGCLNDLLLGPALTAEADVSRRRVFLLKDAQGNPIFTHDGKPAAGFSMAVNQTFHKDKGWNIWQYMIGPGGTAATIAKGALIRYYGVWVG